MAFSRKDFLRASLLSSAGMLSGVEPFGKDLNVRKTSRLRNRNQSDTGFSISIFSKHLQWLDYPEMAKVAANLGFDGVDLTVRPGGHVLPENVERDLPRAVRAVRDEGLEVYMISTAVGDPEDKHTERILKTASQLEIGNYRTDWFDYDENRSISQNLEAFTARLQRLAEMNSQYDIQGDYQNHAGASFGSAIWDLWIVMEELNSRWIGSQYDVRHATVEGANSWINGFKVLQPFIGTLDIKDFRWMKSGDDWQAQSVPLGTGMVDFKRYFGLLKEYGVQVPMSVHYEYDLGGAEHGASTLNMDRQKFLAALRNDLHTLDGWLRQAGLRRVK